MPTTRRGLIAAALATPAIARAQGSGWRPDRQITMIVAFAAGGGTDTAARTIARFMEKDLGQPVVVLNRPGAGGEIGFTELARARPDGYTIGFINTPTIVTIPIERRARFKLDDFALIANIVDDPGGLWVLADSPVRDFAGLLAAARERPGTLGYGTTGIGSIGLPSEGMPSMGNSCTGSVCSLPRPKRPLKKRATFCRKVSGSAGISSGGISPSGGS